MTRALTLACLLLGLPSVARTEDWPCWLGPRRDGISRETGWRKDWPEDGPPRRFEISIGEGYSAPSVAEGHLALFHRRGGELIVESLEAETGKRRWRSTYPTDYRDRYGYSGGPRCAPVIQGRGEKARVITLGPKGILQSLALPSGKKLWRRDLEAELELEPNFFGVGAAPVVEGNRIFLNLGGTDPELTADAGVALALEAITGRTLWRTRTDGGSYAAPQMARVQDVTHLLVFHRGGLSCLDPADGRERWEFPWRSRLHESVNAATPVVVRDLVFCSATYRTGSFALRVDKADYEVVWKDDVTSRKKALEAHWSTPIHLDGHLYGFSGRHESESSLRCVELETGNVRWEWPSYLGRGSLLYSDGYFIALGERGDLALLRLSPDGHQEVRRLEGILEWPSWTPPVLAHGLLYLRDEHKLLCLDLRPTPTTRRGR